MLDPDKSGLFEKRDLFWACLFFLLFAAIFRDFFFTNRVLFERDTTIIEIPVKKLTVQLLREGHFALWTDAYGAGQPFLANPKNAVLYPASFFYLIFPFFMAFKLYYFFHVLISWLGLYYLSKSYSLTRRSSFLGACLFTFGGMYLSSFEFYSHIAALAWMPWILVVLRASQKRSIVRIALLAAIWTLMILAGAPEFVIITAVLAIAQAFSQPVRWKSELVSAGLSLVLAFLISAVQLVPSLELLRQTGRESVPSTWPLELLQLPNLVFPDILGNDRQPGHNDFWGWHLFDKKFPLYYSLYMGFGVIVLTLLALRKPRDRVRLALLIAFAVFFIVSSGRYSPFYFLHRVVPFLSSIRYPVKFFLGSVFCLSLLAAMGFDRFAKGEIPGRRFIRSLVLVAVIPSAAFWLLKNQVLGLLNKLLIIDLETSIAELAGALGIGLFLLATYTAILIISSSPNVNLRLLSWLLLSLAVLDPAYHNRFVNPTIQASFFDKPPLVTELGTPLALDRTEIYAPFLKETLANNVRLLGYFRKSIYPFTSAGDGVRYVLNVDFYGTYSQAYREKVQAVKNLPLEVQAKVLRSMGCNYYIGGDPRYVREEARKIVIEGLPIFIEKILDGSVAPFVARMALQAGTQEERLGVFSRESFDPLRDAVVSTEIETPRPGGEMETQPGQIFAIEEARGYGRYRIILPRDAVVVFPGNCAPGWRARIDGQVAEVFEANLFSKGIILTAGEHEVVLKYLPRSFVLGAAVSLTSVVLLAIGVIWTVVRTKRTGRPGRP